MIVDQRIEERESLRHSTHRSQRSDRVQGGAHTATDRFGNTVTDGGEHQDRPGFHHLKKGANGALNDDADEAPEMYTEMPH